MKYILTANAVLFIIALTIMFGKIGAETPIEPMPALEKAPKDPCWYVKHLPNQPITPIIIREQIKAPIECNNIADLG
jgi:hypothetical protein